MTHRLLLAALATAVLAFGACGTTEDTIQPGTYQVFHRTQQDTGADTTPAPGTTLTVVFEPDGLLMYSVGTDLNLPSFDIPAISDTTYSIAKYSAGLEGCEGVPCTTQRCIYDLHDVTVTGRASNKIHIETCTPDFATGSYGATTCSVTTAENIFGRAPCPIFGVIDAELVGP
jgi:hypothetical protein